LDIFSVERRRDEMKVKKRSAKDYRVSRWSGGETREFLLFPESASYAGRDFLWRVSSATVELPESDFTPLPDYRRFLTPLSGALKLSQDGGPFRTLGALEVLPFDGGAETKSRGEVTDFNLMLRKGEAEGGMETASLRAGETLRLGTLLPAEAAESETLLIYCYSGAAALRQAGKECVLEVGAYLQLSPEAGEEGGLSLAESELLAIAENTVLAFAWMRRCD
jgi:hypothetical protein